MTTTPPSSMRTTEDGAGPLVGTISSDPTPVTPKLDIRSANVRVSNGASVYEIFGSLAADVCPAGWNRSDPVVVVEDGLPICAKVLNVAPPNPVTDPTTGMKVVRVRVVSYRSAIP